MGWGVSVIVIFVIKTFFARLHVDIRLIAFIAVPVLQYVLKVLYLLLI